MRWPARDSGTVIVPVVATGAGEGGADAVSAGAVLAAGTAGAGADSVAAADTVGDADGVCGAGAEGVAEATEAFVVLAVVEGRGGGTYAAGARP